MDVWSENTSPQSLGKSLNVPCHKIRCFYLDIAIQGFFFPKVLTWDSITSFIYWRLTTEGPPAIALGPFIQSCVWTDVSGNESIFPFGNEGRNPYLEGSQIKLPWWLGGQESVCQAGVLGSIPGLGRSPWRSKWLPTPVFLLGKSHVQKSLVDYSPWGHKRVRHDLAIKWQ